MACYRNFGCYKGLDKIHCKVVDNYRSFDNYFGMVDKVGYKTDNYFLRSQNMDSPKKVVHMIRQGREERLQEENQRRVVLHREVEV